MATVNRFLDTEYARLYGGYDARAEMAIALNRARRASGLTPGQVGKLAGTSARRILAMERDEGNHRIGEVGAVLASMGYRMSIKLKPIGATQW